MIKSLIRLWLKDKQLYVMLAFITVISVLMVFIDENTAAIAAMLAFLGGVTAVNDVFSGHKAQLLLSVSPVGRSGYIAGKFIWTGIITLTVLVIAMGMSFVSTATHGLKPEVSMVVFPLVGVMLSMLVNCVTVPCVCLFRREVGTIISFAVIIVSMIGATLALNAFAQDEALFASIFEFVMGLNAFQSCLLAVGGIGFCAALQLLTWFCTRKAHSH